VNVRQYRFVAHIGISLVKLEPFGPAVCGAIIMGR
jgi:hypothetical protein